MKTYTLVVDQRLAKLLTALRRALRALPETADRPRARRNARNKLLAALRGLRAEADSRWPAIRTGKRRQGPKTSKGKRIREMGAQRRAERAGWVPVSEDRATVLGAAGAKLRVVARGNEMTVMVRDWADAIGPNPARLRAARRSKIERDAALAEQALKS
jgi:hypothetical protein